jgi:hypothetical protein
VTGYVARAKIAWPLGGVSQRPGRGRLPMLARVRAAATKPKMRLFYCMGFFSLSLWLRTLQISPLRAGVVANVAAVVGVAAGAVNVGSVGCTRNQRRQMPQLVRLHGGPAGWPVAQPEYGLKQKGGSGQLTAPDYAETSSPQSRPVTNRPAIESGPNARSR